MDVKIGSVIGYAEDVVDGKVYYSEKHTVKFVSDLRVSENKVYRDRYYVEVEEDNLFATL